MCDVFERAKKDMPSLFSSTRLIQSGGKGAGIAGGSEEVEQALYQVLVEMDG